MIVSFQPFVLLMTTSHLLNIKTQLLSISMIRIYTDTH